ncbi:hypothetical protein NQ317_014787 [Molorchus minor]|uniref:Sodium/calcium exchanger membrane region domain-containing protein n=1 Tax=Molorchus minor TaxID=1323400 RepID=A0ABQ9JA49_9CUCU|nr:hypothetical protein NQ317_014787 [Molorchus minor]
MDFQQEDLLGMLKGYLCFVVSIVCIGIVTAFIGDIASHFGATLGIKDAVTAIVFVALGTSIPVNFKLFSRTKGTLLSSIIREVIETPWNYNVEMSLLVKSLYPKINLCAKTVCKILRNFKSTGKEVKK